MRFIIVFIALIPICSYRLNAQQVIIGAGFDVRPVAFSTGLSLRSGYNWNHLSLEFSLLSNIWEDKDYRCFQMGTVSRWHFRQNSSVLNFYAENFISTQIGGSVRGAKLGSADYPYHPNTYSIGNFRRMDLGTGFLVGISTNLRGLLLHSGFGYMYGLWSYLSPQDGVTKNYRSDIVPCFHFGVAVSIPTRTKDQ